MSEREIRMEKIRKLVAKEKAGASVSNLYSAARLLDATIWLLSEIDRIKAKKAEGRLTV